MARSKGKKKWYIKCVSLAHKMEDESAKRGMGQENPSNYTFLPVHLDEDVLEALSLNFKESFCFFLVLMMDFSISLNATHFYDSECLFCSFSCYLSDTLRV